MKRVISYAALAACIVGISASASAALLNVDVTGIESRHGYGDASNVVMTYDIGAGSHVTGLGWDVNLEAIDPSWLSEIKVAVEDSTTAYGVWLAPGAGTDESGTDQFNSGGILALADYGLDFVVGDDGILRLEFFEGYDDSSVNPDGYWRQGLVQVQYEAVPEPASMVILGLGALALLRRKR